MKIITSLLLFGILILNTKAQQLPTLAEKMGYPADAKLLIIHADDLGLSHSTNLAVMQAFNAKSITSGSVMVTCPWMLEIANYVKKNPGLDVGIHLTLTAEWENYKWDGISSSSDIRGLLTPNGFMYSSAEELAKTATASEVEKELTAQIEKWLSLGLTPTHLDNHMGSLLVRPDYLQVYARLAAKYKLPILIPSMYATILPPDVHQILGEHLVMVNQLIMATENTITKPWADFYNQALKNLQPGLNELIVHLSLDNAEMQGIEAGHTAYGSAWRQQDLDFILSPEFRETLQKNHILLVTWKEVGKALY